MRFVWIESDTTLKVILKNKAKFDTTTIFLEDHLGNKIEINKSTQDNDILHISLEQCNRLDFSKNYILKNGPDSLFAYFTRDLINKEFQFEGTLGVYVEGEEIVTRLWSPPALKVEISLFDPINEDGPIKSKKLNRIEHGAWESRFNKSDLPDNFFYSYSVEALGKKTTVLDPYAKSMEGFSPTNPYPPKGYFLLPSGTTSNVKNSDIISTRTDYIGYEMHVRDFTIDPILKIPENKRGTYLGAIDRIPYLQELGITHVQLLPIQSCYTTEEARKKFQGCDVPTGEINYNWGYDAHHYFIPEGWLSCDITDPRSRVSELKKMVSEFHKANIGVIMDVVYNHLYKGEHLDDIAPGCYIRRNWDGSKSGFSGAGDSLESRLIMVRRLIIESLKYFQDEFGINGFRFDLMGFLDHQTMVEIRKALGKDAILYGEGWDFTDIPGEIATTKFHYPKDIEIGFFNDTARDAYTGRMEGVGFIQGSFSTGPRLRSAVIGGIKNYPLDYNNDGHIHAHIDQYLYHCFAEEPHNTLNFLSIHDGYTLWDKINLSVDAGTNARKKMVMAAFAMLLTSQGRVMLHGGDERGRTKPLSSNDPTKDRAHTSPVIRPENGISHFHENSYRSPDCVNMFNWREDITKEGLFEYVQGLIQLRREIPALRYSSAENIKSGLRFIAEKIPNSAKAALDPNRRHSNWEELTFLKINFLGGPPNDRLYIIGEVYPGHYSNPRDNPYYVDFDTNGKGEINFNREQIDSFDFLAWGKDDSLQIKLVKTPGEWDSPEGYYSKYGYNSVLPTSIKLGENIATIDLNFMDHTAGDKEIGHNGHIAFLLDNKIEPPISKLLQKYDKILVVYNGGDSYSEIESPRLEEHKNFDVLVDSRTAGVTPLKHCSVKVIKNYIKVPGKSVAVVGCYS